MTRSSRWWGEVPSAWSRRRFKTVFVERDERSVSGDEALMSVSAYTGVSPRADLISEGDHLTRASSLEGYKVCYPDDLVMNIMLAWNRGLGFSQQKGIVSPAYSVFRLTEGSSPRFMDYLVRSDYAIKYFKAFSAGVIDSRLRLYPDTFGQLHCYLPPLSEQTAIAAFLDRETGKIDALVEEQKRLIELLKEKRQAVVSHAVTKGLDPNVPIKSSGVEWMGDVPEHWEVVRLASLYRFVKRQNGDGYEVLSVYRDYGVIPKASRDDNINKTPDDLSKYQTVLPGDLVINKMKAWQGSLGVSGQVGITSPDYAVFEPIHAVSDQYLNLLLRCSLLPDIYRSISNGIRPDQWRIEPDKFRELRLPMPPKEEQVAIARYLAVTAGALDALYGTAEDAIALLIERRAALISAAVTGKIDVRQLQQNKGEAA